MNAFAISPQQAMSEILGRWPETIPVFIRYRMECVGCYLSTFDTLEEAAVAHHIPLDTLVEALNQEIDAQNRA
ncbi:MAG TPA: DUF1858 domain-containing protein [Anaerolineales bacterium]|nr:DUF1858 domain-containing protein [Anaerolineales bacterium]